MCSWLDTTLTNDMKWWDFRMQLFKRGKNKSYNGMQHKSMRKNKYGAGDILIEMLFNRVDAVNIWFRSVGFICASDLKRSLKEGKIRVKFEFFLSSRVFLKLNRTIFRQSLFPKKLRIYPGDLTCRIWSTHWMRPCRIEIWCEFGIRQAHLFWPCNSLVWTLDSLDCSVFSNGFLNSILKVDYSWTSKKGQKKIPQKSEFAKSRIFVSFPNPFICFTNASNG